MALYHHYPYMSSGSVQEQFYRNLLTDEGMKENNDVFWCFQSEMWRDVIC
jgi:hypothetical protein